MQTLIRRLLIFVVLVFLPLGCFLFDGSVDFGQPNSTVNIDTIHPRSQIVVYEDTINTNSLDSILKIEELPNIDTWSVCEFYDYETGNTVTKSMYFQINKDGSTTYYVVTGDKSPYIIEKRIEK